MRRRIRDRWRGFLCAIGKCPRGKAGWWCNGGRNRCGWPE